MAGCWPTCSEHEEDRGDIEAPLVGPAERSEIEKALARVDAACPDAINARDALERCNDYILGVGNQQMKTPGDYSQLYTRGGPTYIVRVGDLCIDVELAERAAMHLANVVLGGTDHLDLLPPR